MRLSNKFVESAPAPVWLVAGVSYAIKAHGHYQEYDEKTFVEPFYSIQKLQIKSISYKKAIIYNYLLKNDTIRLPFKIYFIFLCKIIVGHYKW